MKIFLFETAPTQADLLIEKLKDYGKERAFMAEMFPHDGASSKNRALILVFNEKGKVLDPCVLIFIPFYSLPDTLPGAVFQEIQAYAKSTDQFMNLTDYEPSYLAEAAEDMFSIERTVKSRKEAVEEFLTRTDALNRFIYR